MPRKFFIGLLFTAVGFSKNTAKLRLEDVPQRELFFVVNKPVQGGVIKEGYYISLLNGVIPQVVAAYSIVVFQPVSHIVVRSSVKNLWISLLVLDEWDVVQVVARSASHVAHHETSRSKCASYLQLSWQ